MKIKISADSTCDLSPELIARYNIGITPLYIVRGDETLRDGIDVHPEELYAYAKATGKLCQTAAVNVSDYYAYFSAARAEYDAVIHFTISSDMSACYQNACIAAQEFTNVYPVDSRSLSTGIGQLVTLAFYLVIYRLRPVSVHITCKGLHGTRGITARLYAVGIPAALNLALPSLLISCLNALLAGFSQAYVVVLGIYYKLQTFLYLPASGIIQGMRPVIGYNYGAGERERVSRIFQVALALCAFIMMIGTVLCLAFASPLMALFTENIRTVVIGAHALRIICVGFLVSAVSVTASGALEGLGKGTASLVISLCRYTVVILPIAVVLCRIMGANGVWHAFWVTEFISAGVALVAWKRV